MNAINSVFSQEDVFNYEIIIVDDGSTDGTKELFNKKDDKVMYNYYPQNKGVNYARNYAIKQATGDYVILLDSDDVLTDDAFRTIKRRLKKMKNCNFFGTANTISKNKLCKGRTGFYDYQDWLSGKIKGCFAPVVNRKVFDKYTFDEEMFCFEIYFFNHVIKEYGVQLFDEILKLINLKEQNRVSYQMLELNRSPQRYSDYCKYLQKFGDDYKRIGVYGRYLLLVLKKWFYLLLKIVYLLLNFFQRNLSYHK